VDNWEGGWLQAGGGAVLLFAQASAIFAFVRCWKSDQLARFFIMLGVAIAAFVACAFLGYFLDPDRRAGVPGGGIVGVLFGSAAGIVVSGIVLLVVALTTSQASP